MLDIKRIRQNPEALVEAMRKRRNKGADVTALLELDAKRREVMQEVEQLKAKRNEGSAKVPAMKKAGEDTTALMAEMKELGARVKELDDQIAKMDEELQSMLMSVPNIPHESVPGLPPGTRHNQLLSGYPYRQRLYRDISSLYGKPGFHDRHRPASQI